LKHFIVHKHGVKILEDGILQTQFVGTIILLVFLMILIIGFFFRQILLIILLKRYKLKFLNIQIEDYYYTSYQSIRYLQEKLKKAKTTYKIAKTFNHSRHKKILKKIDKIESTQKNQLNQLKRYSDQFEGEYGKYGHGLESYFEELKIFYSYRILARSTRVNQELNDIEPHLDAIEYLFNHPYYEEIQESIEQIDSIQRGNKVQKNYKKNQKFLYTLQQRLNVRSEKEFYYLIYNLEKFKTKKAVEIELNKMKLRLDKILYIYEKLVSLFEKSERFEKLSVFQYFSISII